MLVNGETLAVIFVFVDLRFIVWKIYAITSEARNQGCRVWGAPKFSFVNNDTRKMLSGGSSKSKGLRAAKAPQGPRVLISGWKESFLINDFANVIYAGLICLH